MGEAASSSRGSQSSCSSCQRKQEQQSCSTCGSVISRNTNLNFQKTKKDLKVYLNIYFSLIRNHVFMNVCPHFLVKIKATREKNFIKYTLDILYNPKERIFSFLYIYQEIIICHFYASIFLFDSFRNACMLLHIII